MNFPFGSTVYLKFSTANTSQVPTTLAGSPVISVYPDGSTTQITAGVTLTVDFDGVTGLNHVAIVATAANGYNSSGSYAVVVTTGTVNSVSWVGRVVGGFTLNASTPLWTGICRSGADNTASSIALPANTTLAQVHPNMSLELTSGTASPDWMPVYLVSGMGGATPVAYAPTGWTFQGGATPDSSTNLKAHPDPGVIYTAAQLSDSGKLQVDVEEVLGVQQVGSGVAGDNYRPSGAPVG